MGAPPKIDNEAANASGKIREWRAHPLAFVREVFGVEPDAWQAEVLEAFPHQPRIAMKACAGPGKAQPVDMVIETPDGPRRWGDLCIGDRVFAEDGTATRVVAVYDRGIKDLYRVAFDDGTSTLVCDEHLWKVRGRTERRHFADRSSPNWTPGRARRALAQGWPQTPADGYAILSTAEIIERNRSGDGTRRQFEIPRQGAVELPAANLPVDPYVLGCWLGDGSRRSNRGSWRDLDIDAEFERRGYKIGRTDRGRSVTVFGLAAGLRAAGVFALGSHERFVPPDFLRGSVQQRMDILRGLMDTDGTIASDRSMSFDVTSARLVDDVAWLVRSLGGIALQRASKRGSYRAPDGERIDCRTCYRLTVTLPFNPFIVGRKAERWRLPQARYLTRYIDRIEPAGSAYVRCIEVEHPSHCYLANDFIVTHNTAVLSWLGWNFLVTRPHPICGATSISGANLKTALWTEFSRWYAKSPILQASFEVTKSEIFLREHPKTWKLEARTWAADADASQIGNALAGVHAQYALWLLDESGDYPDAIMPVCEGIFSGNPKEAHIVQAGNPTRLGGPLHRACTVARKLWYVVNITADPDDPKRTPRVSKEIARQQIEQYGRDNPWVIVRIFGEFPPSSFNALIGPDEVEAAMKRVRRPEDLVGAARVLGVDVAQYGDDQSVIFPRQGVQAFTPKAFRNVDSLQGAGTVVQTWNGWDADACFIDNTGGFGAGWIDQTRVLGKTAIGVGFAEKPYEPRYWNKRAEMYFNAVQWIRDGGGLPYCPELLAALTRTTYSFKGDKLILQPKDIVKAEIGYSPDHADAFVLTFAHPVQAKARSLSVARPVHKVEYDPFASVRTENPRPGALHQSSYDPYRGV